jgi:hypothetical protein
LFVKIEKEVKMVDIHIEKKDLWLVSAIFVFILGVGLVVSFNDGNPQVHGHHANDIEGVSGGTSGNLECLSVKRTCDSDSSDSEGSCTLISSSFGAGYAAIAHCPSGYWLTGGGFANDFVSSSEIDYNGPIRELLTTDPFYADTESWGAFAYNSNPMSVAAVCCKGSGLGGSGAITPGTLCGWCSHFTSGNVQNVDCQGNNVCAGLCPTGYTWKKQSGMTIYGWSGDSHCYKN